jgi:SAM-dependent methyltransferase
MQSSLSFTDTPVRELVDEDFLFLRTWIGDKTGIKYSNSELQQHIVSVHDQIKTRGSNGMHVYSCMSSLSYLHPRSRLHPVYSEVVSAAKSAGSSYKILDVGSCLGQDTRSLIVDGVSPLSITTSDVHELYWDAGLSLFMDRECNLQKEKSTAGTSSEGVIEENVDNIGSRYNVEGVTTFWGDWATPLSVRFAADLKGTFDAVLAKNVLHAFSAEQCDFFLARMFRMLKSGGVFFGTCTGRAVAKEWVRTPDGSAQRWLHDRDTLEAALRKAGFDGEVSVVSSETKEGGAGPTDLVKDKRYLTFTARKK